MINVAEMVVAFPCHTSDADAARQRTLKNFSFRDAASIKSSTMGQTASTVQTPATPQPDAAAPKVSAFVLA